MIVKLYTNFNKRANSTLQPDFSLGLEENVALKDGTSVEAPVLILQTGNFQNFTYCYIPTFDRCYYVDDIVSVSSYVWEIHLRLDVLATHRTKIGNYSGYCLRSSKQWDGRIIDTLYPLKAEKTNQMVTDKNPLNGASTSAIPDINGGCFVVGIVGTGSGNFNFGSVRYYAFTRDNLNVLVTQLLTNVVTEGNGFSVEDMTLAIQKAIVDPMQFIKSCIWLPVDYNSISNVIPGGTLEVSGYTIRVTNKQLNNNPPSKMFTQQLTIPAHPYAATRGWYMNTEPFTRAQLFYPPFGLFDLDTTCMVDASTLAISVYLDLITGQGTLRVGAEGDGKVLVYTKAQVGVPINLAQVTNDVIGMAAGVGGGVVGMVAGGVSGNVLGLMGGLSTAIGSIVNAMRPSVTTIGGNGCFSDLYGRIALHMQFYTPAEEDLTNKGRPLCAWKKVSDLGGYMEFMDADILINGFAGEQEQVRQYMQNGFFYE